MATNELKTKENICDAALALLRQDIGYSGSDSVKTKCDNVWQLAVQTVKTAHNWKDGWGSGVDGVANAEYVNHALVYALARELAIPITGRQEDLKSIDALYTSKIQQAISTDLDLEMGELRKSPDEDDKFAAEVLDLLKQYYSTADSDLGNGRPKPQPRGIKVLVDQINNIKENIRKEILLTFDWSFAKTERRTFSKNEENGKWRTPYPGDAVKIISCFNDLDEREEAFTREGMWLISQVPIRRVVYIYDDEKLDEWNPLTKTAYIHRVAFAVAMANPELMGNNAKVGLISQVADRTLQDARTMDARQNQTGRSVYGRNHIFDIMTGVKPVTPTILNRGIGWSN